MKLVIIISYFISPLRALFEFEFKNEGGRERKGCF